MEIEHSEVAGNGRSVSVTSVQDELKTEWKKSLKAFALPVAVVSVWDWYCSTDGIPPLLEKHLM